MEYKKTLLKAGDKVLAINPMCCGWAAKLIDNLAIAEINRVDAIESSRMRYNFSFIKDNDDSGWWGCKKCVIPYTPHNVQVYKQKLLDNLLTGE